MRIVINIVSKIMKKWSEIPAFIIEDCGFQKLAIIMKTVFYFF